MRACNDSPSLGGKKPRRYLFFANCRWRQFIPFDIRGQLSEGFEFTKTKRRETVKLSQISLGSCAALGAASPFFSFGGENDSGQLDSKIGRSIQ